MPGMRSTPSASRNRLKLSLASQVLGPRGIGLWCSTLVGRSPRGGRAQSAHIFLYASDSQGEHMDAEREKHIREEMGEFAKPANIPSAVAFAVDVLLFTGGIAGAVLAEPIWVKLAAVVIAGVAISMLFILGHDAAHMSLFSSRRANAIFGRITFLPCLHNYTLWIIQHNRLHHQSTNVRGLNSFSPTL